MKKGIINKIVLVIALFFITFSFNIAFAQNNSSDVPEGTTIDTTTPKAAVTATSKSPIKLDNPIKANNIQQLLFQVVDIMIFIGAIVAVFAFIWIGFKLILAQGNESALKEAKEYFLAAVIGTAILIGSKVIVEVMKNTLVSAGVVDQSQFTQQK